MHKYYALNEAQRKDIGIGTESKVTPRRGARGGNGYCRSNIDVLCDARRSAKLDRQASSPKQPAEQHSVEQHDQQRRRSDHPQHLERYVSRSQP
jgi:hypothetical protein